MQHHSYKQNTDLIIWKETLFTSFHLHFLLGFMFLMGEINSSDLNTSNTSLCSNSFGTC